MNPCTIYIYIYQYTNTPLLCYIPLQKLHSASHFAPTAKNPQSSRGHICYVTTVHLKYFKDDTNGVNSMLPKSHDLVTHWIVVDLAGSGLSTLCFIISDLCNSPMDCIYLMLFDQREKVQSLRNFNGMPILQKLWRVVSRHGV